MFLFHFFVTELCWNDRYGQIRQNHNNLKKRFYSKKKKQSKTLSKKQTINRSESLKFKTFKILKLNKWIIYRYGLKFFKTIKSFRIYLHFFFKKKKEKHNCLNKTTKTVNNKLMLSLSIPASSSSSDCRQFAFQISIVPFSSLL